MPQKKLFLCILAGLSIFFGLAVSKYWDVVSRSGPLAIISSYYENAFQELSLTLSETLSLVSPVEKFLPKKSPTAADKISNREVIDLTNFERGRVSLLNLKENNLLNLVADARLKDMFERQYFAHISPTGDGVTTTAKVLNYKYITIAENIALGDFADEADVVSAWMNSPGHRANILSSQYEEIGMAAGYDLYEGNKTWILVQVFGRPLSSCSLPDKQLKISVDSYTLTLSELGRQAKVLMEKLNSWNPSSKEEVEEYNRQVDVYNSLVKSINDIQSALKSAVASYNVAVSTYNNCLVN